MNEKEFNEMVGETLKFCQIIEHDMKIIYAGMHKGDFNENLERTESWSLGTTINTLEELDFSDDDNYLDKDDYETLKTIKDERNYIGS